MFKIISIILISVCFLFANDKVIEKIVNEYNPKIPISEFKFTKSQLDELCGVNHYSSVCETTSIYTKNELRKKRIKYLLEEISEKYNIEKKLVTNLNDTFIKYMEENQEIVQFSLDCYSSICYEKTIWTELFYFENILTFVLTDKIDEESKTDFEIEDIMVNYNKIIEQLPYLKLKKEYEVDINYDYIQNHFFAIDKSWKEYESTFIEFLKQINKYDDIEWQKIFYSHRYNSLVSITEYFYSIIPAIDSETDASVQMEIKDEKSFINIHKLK